MVTQHNADLIVATGTLLSPHYTTGVQNLDDEKDSPYDGRCWFELVYQARFSLEIKRASWLDTLALSLHTVTLYIFP